MIQACITYGDALPTVDRPFGEILRAWWVCDTCGCTGDEPVPTVCPECGTPSDETGENP